MRRKLQTQEEVRERILRCTRCELSSRAGVFPVPWHGPTPSEIAIIGEAPGFQENVQGKPFVEAGASGRLLRHELSKHGVSLDDCFVANAVSCFPGATPTVSEQRACRLHLQRQLRIAQPRLILTLGAVALNFFAPNKRISKCHGECWDSPRWGRVFPSYHPSAALRFPETRGAFEEDIAAFCQLALSLTHGAVG